jgi:hypothetical protein
MLRSAVDKMHNLRAILSFQSLCSFAFAQNYILQDDYTVANFFNMFSFYTVGGRSFGPSLRVTDDFRETIQQTATFNT